MKIKKIYNNLIPVKGFTALTLWPFIFVRCGKILTKKVERHETTHALQQLECLFVFFLLIYCLEWFVKIPFCGFSRKKAYLSISFEQEAYEHQDEVYYNEVRKDFAWLKYVFAIK